MTERLKPYRVQWRPDLTTSWIVLSDEAEHDAAMAVAEEKRAEFGGQTRVIAQHVIATLGLGGGGVGGGD
jgi:hypothetical protein